MDNEATDIEEQVSKGTISLESRTLRLVGVLSENSEELSNMLRGAWITLDSSGNPDMLPQVAHSMRELMEKAHDYMVEVPVKQEGNGLKSVVISLTEKWSKATEKTKTINTTDWSGSVDSHFQKILKALGEFFSTFSAEHRPRGAQHKAVLETLDGSGQPVPEAITRERLRLWGELDDYFKSVAHHQKATTKELLREKIVILEDFILDIKYPERAVPIDALNELDSIIAEGEAA